MSKRPKKRGAPKNMPVNPAVVVVTPDHEEWSTRYFDIKVEILAIAELYMGRNESDEYLMDEIISGESDIHDHRNIRGLLLAGSLLKLPGVTGICLYPYEVVVDIGSAFDWVDVMPGILKAIAEIVYSTTVDHIEIKDKTISSKKSNKVVSKTDAVS